MDAITEQAATATIQPAQRYPVPQTVPVMPLTYLNPGYPVPQKIRVMTLNFLNPLSSEVFLIPVARLGEQEDGGMTYSPGVGYPVPSAVGDVSPTFLNPLSSEVFLIPMAKLGEQELTLATIQRAPSTRFSDLEPEYALLGAVLKQACRDATQTAKPALSVEAWQFLEICAPTLAVKLSKQHQSNIEAAAIQT